MSSTRPNESIFRTRWTLINIARDAGGDKAAARRAMDTVLKQYRPAILGAIQRSGIRPADCEDACQDYLATTFLTKTLPKAEPAKGKFRTFLFHTLRRYVIDYRRKEHARKRGAFVTDSLEDLSPGSELENALAVEPRQELEMEKDFAWCIHSRVLDQLKADYARTRQLDVYTALVPHIFEKEPDLSKCVSEKLGRTPNTVSAALSRLRKRYREDFLEHVKEISDDDEDPKQEMKELLKLILSRIDATVK